MRFSIVILVTLVFASTAAAIEPAEFPTIATDQTRGFSVNSIEPDILIPPDETSGSGIDPCKLGTRYPDQRCLKEDKRLPLHHRERPRPKVRDVHGRHDVAIV